ncbi:hypothetical protein LSH36_280g01035 [Paralvinella palmiformis]|uniref:Uncharacterized protein n=1 Tax=Paralvinella palmiformis TaxID=53620 RepID=A0AAD9N1S0_9ANNE|nr:hypothetical protein LSH36_280g01035 [Paralvinella palmiformis]
MAFFSVIRYTGDEDDTADKTKKENILQKLHEAAEQRRRSKQLEIVVNVDKEICTNGDHDEVGDPETMTEEALPRESSDEEYEEKNVEDEEFASQPAITGPSPKEDCFTVLVQGVLMPELLRSFHYGYLYGMLASVHPIFAAQLQLVVERPLPMFCQ